MMVLPGKHKANVSPHRINTHDCRRKSYAEWGDTEYQVKIDSVVFVIISKLDDIREKLNVPVC